MQAGDECPFCEKGKMKAILVQQGSYLVSFLTFGSSMGENQYEYECQSCFKKCT